MRETNCNDSDSQRDKKEKNNIEVWKDLVNIQSLVLSLPISDSWVRPIFGVKSPLMR
ncbi:hypothetical protein [Neobacillus drentensis]|jgi:hypothetical protein|uniref:hypothetical protein n=1 Tax=Neobacillus drentensis TaxID=220684 RepID=UPI002FFEAB8E